MTLPVSQTGSDHAAWADFFRGFPAIVLVANSDAADVAALRREYGSAALFVFFNKVYKVLSQPFEGNSLLVARSSQAGANIVYRKEVEDVLRLLRGRGFRGILNLKAGDAERFSPAQEFGAVDVGYLDLVERFTGFYPATHVPTSGFALALWLAEQELGTRVVLAGFTAKRSLRWKLFTDHEWTFEQVVQRLMVRTGRIEVAGAMPAGSISAIAGRFDGISEAEVALVASDVLSERLESANVAIDGLIALTRLQRRFDSALRALKPKTRKARLLEKEKAENPG
ncbi:3-deoxy-manno-octulosonate cytidylyltransferase [Mangrovicella endophytica]|uniref:3-deoxy-manno-octulosonate cytidylyltransferase n=1 Tax=Mangrovicella endophytica TaxID=2066697 RepID=UPI000C9DF49F|nr:3-deoxy-manno-octulosonate cytidylyltransferase [Mangrovicella endophytica]